MTRFKIENTIAVSVECTGCGKTQTVHRRKNKRRKKGHVKDVWCVKCGEKTPHTEIGPE